MKRKNLFTAMAAAAMTMAMSVTAFAAGWEHNDTGWWYATNDAKTEWHHDGWQWVDGNNDGTAECYYFDGNGYILTNTTTPDGYTVNGDGAWVENGVVKTQATGQAGAGNEQQTTAQTEYPNVSGFYNDVYWHEYILIEVESDGTLNYYNSDANGAKVNLKFSLPYVGNGTWSDGLEYGLGTSVAVREDNTLWAAVGIMNSRLERIN